MTAFQIICTIINFVILAGGVWLCGRKIVANKLQSHRQEVEASLKEAEEASAAAAGVEEELERHNAEGEARLKKLSEEAEETRQGIRLDAEQKLALERGRREELLQGELKREKRSMRRRVGYATVKRLSEAAAERAKSEPFASLCAERTPDFARQAIAAVKLSRMDMLALREGRSVRAELASAQPLSEEIKNELREALRAQAGQEIDCAFIADESLISGVRLTVGDTLYEMNLSASISKLCREAETIDADETPEAALGGFIAQAETALSVGQVGRVMSVSDGICHVSGLSDVMSGEMLELPHGVTALVLDLDEESVGCVLLGEYEKICAGDAVYRTGLLMETPVGEAMLGRVVNALGKPVDGLGPISANSYRLIESLAPAVIDRKSVSVPLRTGLKAVDALIPIGRGQRELIIGDRQTGKTAIAIDTIINQKGTGVICIYVAVGQKEATVAAVVDKLKRHGAMDYTIVVSANACEAAPMLYIAPYAGTAIGEYFMYSGRDVLIVYDDLSKQAAAYRELSLLLRRPSGREAYPGDIFYLHSRLLERTARLSDELGGGSMTALPIVETQAGDISAYIPTNVISITDGQIFLETGLFNEGVRPAINVGLSVSRVGGAAQTKAMKQVAGRLRGKLAQYRELEAFSQFGSDLDEATQKTLALGARLTAALKQPQYAPMPEECQVLELLAVDEGFADGVAPDDIPDFGRGLIEHFKAHAPELMEILAKGDKLSDETLERVRAEISEYLKAAG